MRYPFAFSAKDLAESATQTFFWFGLRHNFTYLQRKYLLIVRLRYRFQPL